MSLALEYFDSLVESMKRCGIPAEKVEEFRRERQKFAEAYLRIAEFHDRIFGGGTA